MGKLITLAKAEELSPGQARAFDVEGEKIAVFNVDGNYYAIEDTCTHDQAPLSDGEIEGTTVICPWHMAEFDLKTGEVLTPPATQNVKSYKVFNSRRRASNRDLNLSKCENLVIIKLIGISNDSRSD